ncbi:MAG: hypothetical protein IPK81_21110 [Rhodospirillales bacterium]|nr:MAG: hypothetical protein IPK81_21110 [Rhodospirillales bacterium]
MADDMDWIAVTSFRKTIGAVGFIGSKAVAIAAFFADADGNQDGTVSWGEWLASKAAFDLTGKAVTEVAMQARYDLDIVGRDPSFNDLAISLFANFAQGLIAQGIYIAYFSQGVSLIGGGIAKTITASMIKQFVIRKGFEAVVKKAFLKAAGH